MLHELVHTVELNHSSRFRATLAAVAPGYRERDAEYRNAWRLTPDWARFAVALGEHGIALLERVRTSCGKTFVG